MYVFLTVCVLFVCFILVLCIRALAFKPKAVTVPAYESVDIDAEKAVNDLAEMIRCKTVSNTDKNNEDAAEFAKFYELLPKLFPEVFRACSLIEVGEKSILLKWEGKRHDMPTVLMAHYDVVSVVNEDWEKPPFDGIIEDGVLWGRGTLDTKGSLNGVMQAAEKLISEGFVPENDIYMAFGGDEEVNGHGATDIVEYFKANGLTPGVVLDEGGAVVEKVFPGVTSPCALIGIAEKGMLNVEYSVKGGGGHASSPAPHTPVGKLSAACVKLEKKPFKFTICTAARKMFDTLGRHSTFLYRLIFSNLWLFSPVLDLITRKSGGELNAIMRTTVAFTQMEGSKGMNVIPPYARMVSNSRLIPGETMNSAVERIKKTVSDDSINVRVINGMNPSVISSTDCEGWERVNKAILNTWSGVIVSPYLMFACSDSRHWGEISDRVYRFSPMALSKEERATIHGNNERVPVATVVKTVEFYVNFIKNS